METADKKSMTQREALESGRLGGFNAALLKAAESEDVQGLLEAFGQADHINLERLEAVFPDGYAICRRIYNDWPQRISWRRPPGWHRGASPLADGHDTHWPVLHSGICWTGFLPRDRLSFQRSRVEEVTP